MMLLSRLSPFAPLLLLATLAGCGFQPLYGTGAGDGNAAQGFDQVAIATIPDREGQVLRNYLIDRLYRAGRPTTPAYRLEISLQQSDAALGIRRDATASRTRRDMTARYALRQQSDGKLLLDGRVNASVSYNQLDGQYATLTAREDATSRALNEVGEQIVNRLALYFGTTDRSKGELPAAQHP